MVNPLQHLILASPIQSYREGQQAGLQRRQMQRQEKEEQRAIEQRNAMQQLVAGYTPETDQDAFLFQAQQLGPEAYNAASGFIDQRGARESAKKQQAMEWIGRQVATIDGLPPEQQDAAYQRIASALPPEWQGIPYAQARAQAVAMLRPADQIFPQDQRRPTSPKVINGVLVSDTGEVLYDGRSRSAGPSAPSGDGVSAPTGPVQSGEAIVAAIEAEQGYPLAPEVRAQIIADTESGGGRFDTGSMTDVFSQPEPPEDAPAELRGIWRMATPEQRRAWVERKMAPPAPASKPPTNAQDLAAGFYRRMTEANSILDRLERTGFQPGNLRDTLTAGQGWLRNWYATNEGQQYRQAAENWVRANLRRESGAAIPPDEMEREVQNYFPQPGDGMDVIRQKAENRKLVTQNMLQSAGRAAQNMAPVPSEQAPTANVADDQIQAILDMYPD